MSFFRHERSKYNQSKKVYGVDKPEVVLGSKTVNKPEVNTEDFPGWITTLIIIFLSLLLLTTLTLKNVTGADRYTSNITSKKIEKIEISVKNKHVGKNKGEKIQIAVEPLDAYTRDLKWIITNKKAVKVENNTATGIEKGTAKIKLANKYISSNEITLSSVDVLEKIEIQNPIKEIPVTEKHKYEIKYLPENAYNKEISIESINSDVLKVDKNGEMHAIKPGETKILFIDSYGTILKEEIVKVKWDRVTSITLDESNIVMGKGQKYIVNAEITPSNATFNNVEWTSKNEDILTVDERGVITAKNPGSTTITAKIKNEPIEKSVQILVLDVFLNGDSKYSKRKQNIYSKPNEKSKPIIEIIKNEKLDILGEFENWYKVRSQNGEVGYIENSEKNIILEKEE